MKKFVVTATTDGIKYWFAPKGVTKNIESAQRFSLDEAQEGAKIQNNFEKDSNTFPVDRWFVEEISE